MFRRCTLYLFNVLDFLKKILIILSYITQHNAPACMNIYFSVQQHFFLTFENIWSTKLLMIKDWMALTSFSES